MNQETLIKIKELHSLGNSSIKISKILNISKSCVLYNFKKLNLKPNGFILKYNLPEVLTDLLNKDLSNLEIAKKYDISLETVRNICKSNNIDSRREINLLKAYNYYDIFNNNNLISIIIGTLLGDASLEQTSKTSAKLNFSHKSSNLDYIEYKGNLIKPIFSSIFPKKTIPHYYKNKLVSGEQQFTCISKSSPSLLKLRNIIIKNGKKQITKECLDLMNELSIVLFYYDDGNKIIDKKNPLFFAYKIAMYIYTFEEKQLLSNWLFEKFNIQSTVRKDSVYIKANSKNIFKSMLLKYKIDSLLYKI